MSVSSNRKLALVTGGAGLIGSHLVDLLQGEGWPIRILDNLEPQTHRQGKPPWLQSAVQKGAEFLQGDMRDRGVLESALDGVQVVFHQAAYGGYMPEISKYVAVNSLGTALLLEIIREKNLGVRKIVVASSQVVSCCSEKAEPHKRDGGELNDRLQRRSQLGGLDAPSTKFFDRGRRCGNFVHIHAPGFHSDDFVIGALTLLDSQYQLAPAWKNRDSTPQRSGKHL